MAKVESSAGKQLPKLLGRADAKPAILVDVDDTTLSTYNYEATNDFGYNPAMNAEYIHDHGMTAVFGMPKLLRVGVDQGGIEVLLPHRTAEHRRFGSTQRADTVRDLRRRATRTSTRTTCYTRDKRSGHTADYLTALRQAGRDPGDLLHDRAVQVAAPARTSRARGGYDIVANFGDQFSDL